MSRQESFASLTLLPVIHGRMEFAVEVHRRIHRIRPNIIAVEFPNTLRSPVLEGVRRLPYISIIHYPTSSGETIYLLIEPQDALCEAVRFGIEAGIPIHFIDLDVESYPYRREPMPDSYAISRIGYDSYVGAFLEEFRQSESDPQDARREANMCHHIENLIRKHERVAFVFGLSHYPAILRGLEGPQARPLGRAKLRQAQVAAVHPDSTREIFSEMPYLAERFETERQRGGLTQQGVLDRLSLHAELLEEAAEEYFRQEKEEVSSHQKKVLFQFARNYAVVQGHLVPDFYQLVIAARSAVNDNFAYILWDLASTYRFQEESPSLPVMRVTADDLYLNRKRIRFHRRIKTFRRRLVSLPHRLKYGNKDRAEWKREWRGFSICSYPPEDIAVEGFGEYLKKRAILVSAEPRTRTLPFSTTLADGVDVRETLRNWPVEKRIYIMEQRPMKGKVGSVVIVFDEDSDPHRETYPWKLTWLGEHSQESDMAFYATSSGEHVVGPGISRCVYGGFMLTYPPMRVYDIWEDPFFHGARSKSEKLLMAALDYSRERNVVYAAALPPTSRMRRLADRMGKIILYLPLGMFSPQVLKKMRMFHVLDGHHVRKYARSFIEP